jgi:hypothetical protein
MNKYVLSISFLLGILVGSFTITINAVEEVEMSMITTILENNKPLVEVEQALITQFLQLKREGKLTPNFFIHVIQKYNGKSVLYEALHNTDIQLAQDIYTDVLLSEPKLSSDLKYSVAFHLSRITQKCENDELFSMMKRETDLNLAMLMAKAFINSRRGQLEEISMTWAKNLREREISEYSLVTERAVNQLLFELGSEQVIAEILKNLERLGSGGTTDLLMEGVRYLGEAKYQPGYAYCKQKAEDENEDCPVRMEALQAMMKMYPHTRQQEILEVAEKIRTSRSFYPNYADTLDQIILQLKSH